MPRCCCSKKRLEGRSRRITVGANKAYDSKEFVSTARQLNVNAHVTKKDKGRRSNLDRRTTRHAGYALSLSRRWLVEKGFGWLKQTGPLRQVPARMPTHRKSAMSRAPGEMGMRSATLRELRVQG
jgi:hypothetical protein